MGSGKELIAQKVRAQKWDRSWTALQEHLGRFLHAQLSVKLCCCPDNNVRSNGLLNIGLLRVLDRDIKFSILKAA